MKRASNSRKHPEGTGRRPDLSSLKRKEAVERQTYYDGLSVEEKLAKLDAQFGAGMGAKAQREKLQEMLVRKNAPKVVAVQQAVVAEEETGGHMKAKDRRKQERE